MTAQAVRNRASTPTVINTAGRVLGGGETYVYDDTTISPADFAIIQRGINLGFLFLLTGNITIPPPSTAGASYVKAVVSGSQLIFTDSLGGTTALTLPAGGGGTPVDLTDYVKVDDLEAVTVATQDDITAAVAPITSALATKVNSSTYTAGLAGKADTTYVDQAVTPLAAKTSIQNLLLVQAGAPDAMVTGTITRDANGAATSFNVIWPDAATGVFTGTASTAFPGAIDAYTITHVLSGVTTTYTQAAVTRDANGSVTARPAVVVA